MHLAWDFSCLNNVQYVLPIKRSNYSLFSKVKAIVSFHCNFHLFAQNLLKYFVKYLEFTPHCKPNYCLFISRNTSINPKFLFQNRTLNVTQFNIHITFYPELDQTYFCFNPKFVTNRTSQPLASSYWTSLRIIQKK